MATTAGARALGLSNQIGSVEVGKCGDLQLLDLNFLHTTPHPDPVSAIVYAAQTSNVEMVMIDGRIVMRDRKLVTLNEGGVIAEAEAAGKQEAGGRRQEAVDN